MTEFHRFPHTPHLVWLGASRPRADKVLSPAEARDFLDASVVVEEKIDGSNLGFSFDSDGQLKVQSRGSYVRRGVHRHLDRLWAWLDTRSDKLLSHLGTSLILFGEWCAAVHSVHYDALPDWFLAFDVYDREAGRFWSVERRNQLASKASIATVPQLCRGQYTVEQLKGIVGRSRLGSAAMEGVYLRREEGDWLLARAKIVRPEFHQGISEHWTRASYHENGLREGIR